MLDLQRERPFSRFGTRNLKAIRENGERRLQEFDIRAPDSRGPRRHALGRATSRRSSSRASCRGRSRCSSARSRRGDSTSARSSTSTARSSRSATPASRCSSISSELDEVIALGDRIAVMYEGEIVGVVPPSTSREQLGLMMAGVAADERLAPRGRSRDARRHVGAARRRRPRGASAGPIRAAFSRAALRIREANPLPRHGARHGSSVSSSARSSSSSRRPTLLHSWAGFFSHPGGTIALNAKTVWGSLRAALHRRASSIRGRCGRRSSTRTTPTGRTRSRRSRRR